MNNELNNVEEKAWNEIYDMMSVNENHGFNKIAMHVCDAITKHEFTKLELVEILSFVRKFDYFPSFVKARNSRYSNLV